MRYEFHPEALAEYLDAAAFYREQQPGLEVKFVAAIEEAINRVVGAPERWPFFQYDVRRCLTHVFPYGIFYTIEPDYVLILAVMHCSREPGYWRCRRESNA